MANQCPPQDGERAYLMSWCQGRLTRTVVAVSRAGETLERAATQADDGPGLS
jgi:hypothetical protein